MARAKRRGASGGGTIRQRADGRWEARITIGRDPVTGQQKQRSFYGATQREVRQKLQQAAVEVDAETYVEPSRMTLDQWLNIWLTEYKAGLRFYKAGGLWYDAERTRGAAPGRFGTRRAKALF